MQVSLQCFFSIVLKVPIVRKKIKADMNLRYLRFFPIYTFVIVFMRNLFVQAIFLHANTYIFKCSNISPGCILTCEQISSFYMFLGGFNLQRISLSLLL